VFDVGFRPVMAARAPVSRSGKRFAVEMTADQSTRAGQLSVKISRPPAHSPLISNYLPSSFKLTAESMNRLTNAPYSHRYRATPCRWRRGLVLSGVRRMNEVNARRARLVPGWVTVFGRVCHLGM